MYHYGLRRAEALGYESTDAVGEKYLKITQQLKSNPAEHPVYSILKDKEKRNTPHWFTTPSECYKWVQDSLDRKMHPDHPSVLWDEFN